MKLNRSARARLLAAVVILMGGLNVVSSAFFVVTARLHWLREVLPPEVTLSSRGLNLVAGYFLIAVGWNLAQRKRVAWVLTTWLLLVSAFSHVLKGLDFEEALIALALLGLLWWFRGDFSVRSDPGRLQDIFLAAPYAIIFFFAYAFLGFYLLRAHFAPHFDLNDTWRETLNLATFQGEQLYRPLNRQARWFLESLTLMAGVGVLYVFYNLMRPVMEPAPVTRRDRAAAEHIIRTYGSSSIAYFALAHDKTYFFNEEATCVIPYVLVRDVALAAGDPIGPAEEIEPTIRAFRAYCEDNSWVPALYQAEEAYQALYQEMGFETLKVGEDAFIDVATFDLKGKAKEDLRTASNRARREGWGFFFFDRALGDAPAPLHQDISQPGDLEGAAAMQMAPPPSLATQIQGLSEAWLADRFGGEMGFTMGGTPIAGSAETLVSGVTNAAGRVLAFITWAPMFASHGWVADYMRRAPDAPNGVMEYAIVQTIEHLRTRGERLVCLGLAPLANVGADGSDSLVSLERGMELIYERFNTVYRFKSLHHFKEKFAPRWESRYLVYPSLAALPRVAYALVNAQMPSFSLAELTRIVRA